MANNQNFCITAGGTVGLPDCDIVLDKPLAITLSASQQSFSEDVFSDLFAALVAATKVDDSQSRQLPLTGMKQVDDNSVAPTEGTLAGYGYVEPLADGTIAMTFQFPAGLCRSKTLNRLKGLKGYAFIVDAKKQLVGAKDGTGIKGLKFDSLMVDNTGSLWKDGQNVKTIKLKITFGSDVEMIEALRVVKLDEFDADKLNGLQAVEMVKVGALTYRVQTECNGINLFDRYKTQLGDKAVWVVTDLTTGQTKTITSVAAIESSKSFEVSFDTAPVAPYALGVSLAAPSVLTTSGLPGIEQADEFIDNVKS